MTTFTERMVKSLGMSWRLLGMWR